MNFSDFITHHGKRVNREHYLHLIQVSKTDGKINQSEMELLHKEGRKFGLTDPEIDKLIKTEIHNQYHPPYSLREKFEHLYNVAEMILADDVISESEKRMIRRFSIEAGFDDKAIDKLIDLLFIGIRNNESEEALLAKFKIHLFKD
jgi:uncharacterized tellurite resistance protein B-like protein